MAGGRVGVVLLHRGDPASVTEARSWLRARYADPKATRSSFGRDAQGVMAGLFARVDQGRVAGQLTAIGGSSPLAGQVETLAQQLRMALDGERVGTGASAYEVAVGFRYASPSVEGAAAAMLKAGVQRVVGVSLYPQPCRALTASLTFGLESAIAGAMPVTVVDRFHLHPEYLEAVQETVGAALSRVADGTVLFGAVHVEAKELEPDDPYPAALVATAEAVMGPLSRPYKLAWLEDGGPGLSVARMAKRLVASGQQQVVVAPLGTSVDELGTLYALDAQLRTVAKSLGFSHVERAQAPATSPHLAKALAAAITGHLAQMDALGFG